MSGSRINKLKEADPKPTLRGNKATKAGKNVTKNFKKIKTIKAETIDALKEYASNGNLSPEALQDLKAFHPELFKNEKNKNGDTNQTYLPSFAYVSGVPTKSESFVIKKNQLFNEITSSKNTDFTDGQNTLVDTNNDGWAWNDKPLYKDGEVVDINKNIVSTIKAKSLKESIEEAKNKSSRDDAESSAWAICTAAIGKKNKDGKLKIAKKDQEKFESCKKDVTKKRMEEIEDLDETTTAASAGAYTAPLWWPSADGKKPKQRKNWKGGKFVKIKDKCNKYPYCTYPHEYIQITEETLRSIKLVSERTGKTEDEIIDSIVEQFLIEQHEKNKK